MNQRDGRKRAVITGANGGMGRALARSFGETMDLVLVDIMEAPLAGFAGELRDGGYTVSAAIAGDLGDEAVLGKVVEAATSGGGLGAVVHTAALSPAAGTRWDRIMTVNLVATEKFLRALDPVVSAGSPVIVISSNSAYFAPITPEISEIILDPLAPNLLARIAPHIDQLGGAEDEMERASIAYMFSKWAVIELCARRAPHWIRRGARLVTISPGMANTPMGRAERESNPRAAAFIDTCQAGRWVTPMDIVGAARFLASDAASFISGCDIRVDGAGVPAMQAELALNG
ncbi:SDR family oxidoreductase [Sphingobium sp. EM0848]|uniref:SDR family oxidoreductase n=1 Tax=Sphingobium sp. EM0848 TaxID=2743473 RepID=UPI00159C82C8|nr:SDR family oxidoreductase [Sphingobium sp. EM0848]